MRIGIVGFPLSGKTTLLTALSAVPGAHLRPSEENLAAVRIPEPRLELLERLFRPKRCTEITLDFVDLPGTAAGESEHAGLSKHLPTLRQCEGLLLVLRAFESESVPAHGGRIAPQRDLTQLRDELLLADLEICANRMDKLEKAITKPSKERDQQKHELALLQRCRAALENERPLRDVVQPGEEEKLLRSFGLLTLKPAVVVLNIGEAAIGREPPFRDAAAAIFAVCAAIEAELIQMDPGERAAFLADYGIQSLARDRIVRACFNALGLITFLTCGGKEEVRAWALPRDATALDAAGKVHTDMARGFIRAEVVSYDDLAAAGGYKEAKTGGKVRQEPKNYIVQDGDVITVKFNV